MNVGGIGRKFNFFGARDASEFLCFSAGGDVVQDAFFQFADGFGGPHTGVQDVDWFAGKAEIHRSHGELHAAAALQENYRVVVGDGEDAAEALFGLGDDAFEFFGAMAHLHHGHAATAPIEELFADALEYGQGKGTGSGVEIEGALCGGFLFCFYRR